MTPTPKPLPSVRISSTVRGFQQRLVDNLYHTHGQAVQSASMHDAYMALCYTVRDHLIERWRRTTEAHYESNPKFVYYLSAEYLLGQAAAPEHALHRHRRSWPARRWPSYGLDLDDFVELDVEPGLGNGGLGRLAACFIDSLATLDIPAVGYGIRYEFGIFKQAFEDGWQVEKPDEWAAATAIRGSFPSPTTWSRSGFGGTRSTTRTRRATRGCAGSRAKGAGRALHDAGARLRHRRRSTSCACGGRAPPRSSTSSCSTWATMPGPSSRRSTRRTSARSSIPTTSRRRARNCACKQQYFFVACSLHDIIRRFRLKNDDWDQFPDKVAIQLNDTHPVVAIPELMRILVDEHELDWDRAWNITRTTLRLHLPHAAARSAGEVAGRPVREPAAPAPGDHLRDQPPLPGRGARRASPATTARVARHVDHRGRRPQRQVRMAHLASVGSFAINGVAELQSRLLRERTLRDFAELWPDKFQNKTNGVTPRRFMRLANPRLSELITSTIGDGWLTDLDQLQRAGGPRRRCRRSAGPGARSSSRTSRTWPTS